MLFTKPMSRPMLRRPVVVISLAVLLIAMGLPPSAYANEGTAPIANAAVPPPRSAGRVLTRVFLVLAGSAMFTTGYAPLCEVVGGVMCVPIAGPALYVPHVLDHSDVPALAVTLLVGVEVMQVVGIGLVAKGVLMSDRVPSPPVVAAPFVVKSGGGFLLAARF